MTKEEFKKKCLEHYDINRSIFEMYIDRLLSKKAVDVAKLNCKDGMLPVYPSVSAVLQKIVYDITHSNSSPMTNQMLCELSTKLYKKL